MEIAVFAEWYRKLASQVIYVFNAIIMELFAKTDTRLIFNPCFGLLIKFTDFSH